MAGRAPHKRNRAQIPQGVDTVMRTLLLQAHAVGRWREMQAERESRPFLRYVAILDSRTSEICHSLHGTIRPAEDPWWHTHQPPMHWGAIAQGALVTTARGYVPIESVRVGDRVLTHRGRWQPVTMCMSKLPDCSHIIELRSKAGDVIQLTDEHPTLTVSGWRRADELQIGDILFQHSEHVDWKRLLSARIVGEPNDRPSLFDHEPVAYQVSSAPGSVAPAVYLQGEHARWPGEVYEVGADLMLMHGHRGTAGEEIQKRPLVLGHCGSLMLSHGSGHEHTSLPVARRVASAHASAVPSVHGMGILAQPVPPVVGALLLADRDPVAREHARQRGAVNVQVTSDSAQRLAPEPVSALDDLAQEGHTEEWLRSELAHIRRIPCTLPVYNLSVQTDESYCVARHIVHNCRSVIVGIAESTARRRGVTRDDRLPDVSGQDGWGTLPDESPPTLATAGRDPQILAAARRWLDDGGG